MGIQFDVSADGTMTATHLTESFIVKLRNSTICPHVASAKVHFGIYVAELLKLEERSVRYDADGR